MRGAPWARLRSASPRRRIAHDGGVILAQDGSWRFFGRGGEGGDAGRVFGRARVVATRSWQVTLKLGLSIAHAHGVGCRRISGLWIRFGAVQSKKNSSARGLKVAKCPWKTRFVLLDRSRDISREERITGQSMNGGVETQATSYRSPPLAPRTRRHSISHTVTAGNGGCDEPLPLIRFL